MGLSTVFKYLGLVMETANQAADVKGEIDRAKSAGSPGGKEITEDELRTIITNLEDNCGEVIKRICQETNLPVANVTVKVELT